MKNRYQIIPFFLISSLILILCKNVNSQTADNIISLKLNSKSKKFKSIKTEPESDSIKPSGKFTPGSGFNIIETEEGSLNISVFSYVRYLNQKGLDTSYTNAFGKTNTVKQRQDIQLNKVNIKFLGWLMDPGFRYLFYVWTSNTSLGQVSQVVVAGNLQYKINENFNFGAGINSLPGVRSTTGNFPYWLPVDNRLIADEFFRPSYTTGIWANGSVTTGLSYNLMAGNNLSQFGVDAGQLDNGLRTFSGMLRWYPTTGEFGQYSAYGDFDNHKKAATLLSGHFTYSQENKESQPKSDQFENVQLRLSDGSIIFTNDLFGTGITINDAVYKMASFDAGIKFKGFALEGEYYLRWLSNFTGIGTDSLGFDLITDNGFQIMASCMILEKKLMAYTTFSQVFGDYGNPWDARIGLNVYPWKNQSFRWNLEYIQIYKSPVGALSLPYTVGSTGGIFNMDFMVNF